MAQSHDTLKYKLEELEKRYSELTEQMNDPAVTAEPTRMVALAKELSRLSKIAEPYRLYCKVEADRAEMQAILDDPKGDADLKSLASGEINELASAADAAMDGIKSLLVMGQDEAISSIILEIRAGTGGQEAAFFVGDLLQMYRHHAETHNWKFEVLSANPNEMGGFREVIVNIKGEGVWSRLGYEGGGHRVQRVPQTESQGRVHTSAATVAVLPEPEDIDIKINWDSDVEEHTCRAGGPGGQSVNKLESAIQLLHHETGLTVSMRDEKSQHKNRAKARRVLASRVYEYHRSRQMAAEAEARKTMIGSGDRSQRVRTYNFPQNRCTDHRLKGEGQEGANFNLERVIAGNLDDLVDALIARDKAQRLANL